MKLVSFVNLGNTCYLNSVLQCFIYDSYFQELIKTNDSVIHRMLQEIVNAVDINENENLVLRCNLVAFINEFISKKPFFEGFIQNDSHEFLIHFLDLLYSESPFKNDIYGEIKENIKCINCKNNKLVSDEYSSITIPINPLKEEPLIDLLMDYLKTEIHNDPKNLYFCETCNSENISEHKITLWKLPKRLIIVLKRYNLSNKINSEIIFPLDNLKIKESMTNEIKNYKLTGFINHIGDLNEGHYTSCVLINNIWHFIDDESVHIVPEMPNRSNLVYILFYSQI